MPPRTLYELFVQTTSASADQIGFRFKRNHRWHDVTWAEHRASVDRVSRGLLALGVAPGDRVAILSTTRLEWVQADAATVNLGAITVGIYPSELAQECAFILEHSEAGVLFVENRPQLDKILSVRDRLPRLRWLVLLEGPASSPAAIDWEELQRRGDAVPDGDRERAARAIGPDDVASLVYTSGTTGRPKGVMITHRNLLVTARAAERALVFEPHYCTLLFLPLAHVFARLLAYLCLVRGLTTAFAEDLGHVPENLREIRPHFVAGVPRLYEKIHERVTAAAERGGRLRRRLFEWAVTIGRRVEVRRREGGSVPALLALRHAVADRLVLRKVRAVFGGRLVWAASGAAPLNRELCEFYLACGIRLIEGLGMTENTSLSNANRLDRIKPGTVGPVVDGVEMKIAPDGEVLFRGTRRRRRRRSTPRAGSTAGTSVRSTRRATCASPTARRS
jgi:long-chain acyl-CoA synthetase